MNRRNFIKVLSGVAVVCGFPLISKPLSIDPTVVDVRNFGALGDGVTDDSAAIQKALNFAAAHRVPFIMNHGTYKISKGFVIPKYMPKGSSICYNRFLS